MQRYADACPVAGVGPEHYAARVLQVEPTCSVILAIHFRGQAVDFPFVDVSAQSAPLPQPLPLALLIDAFLRFRPRAVRIWQSVADSPPEYGEEDLKIVAGPLRGLQAMPDLPHSRRIRLEPDPELASYADYRRMYERSRALLLAVVLEWRRDDKGRAGPGTGVAVQSLATGSGVFAECGAYLPAFRDFPTGLLPLETTA